MTLAVDRRSNMHTVSSPEHPDWAVEVCRDRVSRAGEVRDEIRRAWRGHSKDSPRRIHFSPREQEGRWMVVLNTLKPMPVRLSVLFGEWLYLLRSTLDGFVYYLAVQDSQSDPPANERNLYFPVFTDPAAYDNVDHRRKLKALSDETFALLREYQPFTEKLGYKSSALWWLQELARIDRHRRGHALAPHIDLLLVDIAEPLVGLGHRLPDSVRAIPVDESAPMPLFEFEAPADWDLQAIRAHWDPSRIVYPYLDVTEWFREVTIKMGALNLDERMMACEDSVRQIIIDALSTHQA